MKLIRSVLLVAVACIAAYSNNSETILKLGDTFYRDSLHSMALSQYEQYVNGSPSAEKLPRVFYRLGVIYKKEGQDSEALNWFRRLMERFPTDPLVKNAHYESALVYQKRKQWFEAGEEFFLVWQVYPVSAEAEEALFNAAQSYAEGGDYQRSVELYQRFLSRYTNSALAGEAAADGVMYLVNQKKYPEAQELLTKSQKLSLKDQWKNELLYLDAKITYITQGETRAEDKLMSLVKNDGVFRSKGAALKLYSELLVQRKAFSDAWSLFSGYKILVSDSLDLSEKMFWGEIAFFAKDYKECELLYKSALKDENVNRDLVEYRLARNYDASGDFYSALNALRQVSGSDSVLLAQNSQLKIAELYNKNGIYANAVQEYRKYLAINGEQSDMVLYRIGRIYQEKLSAPEMALREYDKLLKWYAGSSFVGKASLAMAQIYEQQSKYDEANQAYRYLATLEAETDLGYHAENRSGYLEKFRIPHSVAALSALTELSLSDSLSPAEKRIKGASIYRSYLKERFRAVELLEPLLKDSLSDSLRGIVLQNLAVNWHELSEQFLVEKKNKESGYAEVQAVKYYNSLLESSELAQWHAEATYSLVSLSGEGISGYESFVETNLKSPYRAEAFLHIAEHYENGNSEESLLQAANAYRKAFESGENEIKKSALTGAILLTIELGKLDSANTLINQYKEEYRDELKSEEFSWLQARLLHLSDKYAEAETLYRYIISSFPQGKFSVQSRLYLANTESAQKKYSDAFNNYTLAETLFPVGKNKGQAVLGRIESMILLGRSKDALIEIEKVGAPSWMSSEQKSELAYYEGQAFELEGDSYSAIKRFTAAIANENYSKRFGAMHSAASLNYSLNEYASAMHQYNSLRKAGNDSAFYEMKYLASAILAGKGENVADDYKKFKKGIGKSSPAKMMEIYYAEGLHFYRKKEYDKADKRFSFIQTKGARSELADDAVYYRCQILYNLKKWDDALKMLNTFVSAYSESELVPSAMFTIAMVYHHTEKVAEAAKQYELTAEKAGNDAELRFRSLVNGAVIWQKLSAWESAALLSETVMGEFGERIDSSSYSLKTGFAYLKANRVKKALHYFELAEKNPAESDIPEITYWIALSNLRLGRDEKALELFLKISYLYGNSGKWGVTADFESARIYEQHGEFPKALSLYRKIVRIEGENSPLGGDATKRITALETLMEEF